MDSARQAIRDFTSKSGHHTIVDETVHPAMTNEVVKPTKHEEITQAVDREVHQHHYHTTVQPIQHQEVLPEKHHHNILPVEQREFRHDNEHDTTRRVEAELGAFKDRQIVHDVRTSQSAAPTVTGEHVHHHVHETVVPLINKETIRPEVVHTTVPIHETHVAAAQHHGLSALPMKTLHEFTQAGGILQGGKHSTHEEYEGAPRPYNDKLLTSIEKLGLVEGVAAHEAGKHNHRNTDSGVGGLESGYGNNTTSGPHRSNLENKLDPRVDSDNSRGLGSGVGSGVGSSGYDNTSGPHRNNLENKLDPRVDSDNSRGLGSGVGSGVGSSGYDNTSGPHRSNLENKIDPRVDSDNSRGLGGSTGRSARGYDTDPNVGSTGTGSSALGYETGRHHGVGNNTTGNDSGLARGPTGAVVDPNNTGRMGTTDDIDRTETSGSQKSGGFLNRLTGHRS